MGGKHESLSVAEGPPPFKSEGVQTLRNLVLKSVKNFPHELALVCLSETEDVLEGKDFKAANGPVTSNTNGQANGHTNGRYAVKQSKYLRLTYSQLYAAALRFATALRSKSIGSGDTVCTILYTGTEVSIVAWASFLLGAIWMPLHPRTATNANELRHVLGLTKPAALIAFDGEVAAQLDNDPAASTARVKVMCSEASSKGWSSWRGFLSNLGPLLHIKEDTDKNRENDFTLIVFTSGTTSLPKAAGHTNLTFCTACTGAAYLFNWNTTTTVLHAYPFHHIGGNFPAFGAWSAGAAVVIPSKSFQAEKAVQAMRMEAITDMSLLPSMMLAMHEYDPTPYEHGLEKVTVVMSATTILREHYVLARKYFNMTHFSAPYGATEGLPVTGDIYEVKTFDPLPGPIHPGKPNPGVKVKICAQGSRDPLPRNEIGELHQSGLQVIPGYLNKATEEFYTDESGTYWFTSGDAALMDDHDNVEIIGRIKDMVIRGGVNISPARIEDVVNKLPGVDVAVVAASDVISGEVPVAVLRYTSSERSTTPAEVRESVLKELGPTFALSEVILLEQLGLSDWPKTTSGKVRKVDLRLHVKKYMDELQVQAQPDDRQSLSDTLKEIWAQVLGLPASKLSTDTDLRDLADSLTTMQFRARLRKTLGKNLSIKQLLTAFTIAEQATVLENSQNTSSARPTFVVKRDGPPQLDDVSFVDGDECRFESIKKDILPHLAQLRLTWEDDIEDLIPLWDWGKLEGKRYRPKSNTHRHAFVSEELSTADLQRVLERTITAHPIIRSLGVQEGDGGDRFLAILRATRRYFDSCIHYFGTVDKASDLAHLCLRETQGNTFFPGLLFKIILAQVKETNSAGFVFISQHTIFDAGSLTLFFENFELIRNGNPAIERVSYKLWADMYYNNRTSAKATEAVKFRVQKLKNISTLKQALWPPTRAPGFYFGDDWEWVDPESMEAGDASLRISKEPDQNVSTGLQERGLNAPYDQGVTCAFGIPNLFKLQQAHGIHPVTLIQSSLALANMYMTRRLSALITLANGARTWPFLQSEISELLPEPVDIDGPMVEIIPHAIHLHGESVVEFLKAQQKEQQTLSKYVHAPLFRVREELGSADGGAMMEILRHQVFNWLPLIGKGGMPLKGFRNVQKTHHNDFKVTWAAGMPDAETIVVHADVDRAQLTVKEVQQMQKVLEQAATWMCSEENWNRAAAEFLGLSL